MRFIDTLRGEGNVVESICRVLREQGCRVAARTDRAWRRQRPATRTLMGAHVVNAVRDTAWKQDAGGGAQLTAEACTGDGGSAPIRPGRRDGRQFWVNRPPDEAVEAQWCSP